MRSRAYRRYQRARTVARHRRYILEIQYRSSEPYFHNDIAVRHPADCGRPCGLCHYLPVEYRRLKKGKRREAMAREWVASGGW